VRRSRSPLLAVTSRFGDAVPSGFGEVLLLAMVVIDLCLIGSASDEAELKIDLLLKNCCREAAMAVMEVRCASAIDQSKASKKSVLWKVES